MESCTVKCDLKDATFANPATDPAPQEKRFSASLNAHTHELRQEKGGNEPREPRKGRKDFKLNSRSPSRSQYLSSPIYFSGQVPSSLTKKSRDKEECHDDERRRTVDTDRGTALRSFHRVQP